MQIARQYFSSISTKRRARLNVAESNATYGQYGTPQGVKGHPLEEGHRMIADKIIKHIETQW